MSLLNQGDQIAEFVVADLIKKGTYAESYQVVDKNGAPCFLKLMSLAKMQPNQIDENGNNIEIEVCRGLSHPNLCAYITDGEVILNGQKYVYLVNQFEASATLHDYVASNGAIELDVAKDIICEVLEGLKYLHSQKIPVIHNEITLQNVLINAEGVIKLIDFGNSRFLSQGVARQLMNEDNLFYLAPERLNGVFSVQSDLYSVGVMLYKLIYNQLPYYFDMSLFDAAFQLTALQRVREQPVKLPPVQVAGMDELFAQLLRKALAYDPEQRFQSAEEFIQALEGGMASEENEDALTTEESESPELEDEEQRGNGFADIAGMEEVKTLLTKKVINLLKDPEKAQKYKLSIPNGILLYGPPGCGKTIWAQRISEEAGYRYIYVKASDVLRFYMQGQHNVIASLLKQAQKLAPVTICFDELEQLFSNQDTQYTYAIEAGNEFLELLRECASNKIFVVAVTSRPDLLDFTVRKPELLEQMIYIPMPDKDSRRSLFETQLNERPVAQDINLDQLADMTHNYIINDIAFVVNDAALAASETDSEITQSLLEETIKKKKPSMSEDILKAFESYRDMIENKTDNGGNTSNRPHIGFR